MAEIIGRVLLGITESLFELAFEWTGRTILSRCGLKPNSVESVMVGLVFWVVFGVVLAGIIGGLIARSG
jgi:ABC-type sulfate transport system permease subunit